jgi:hypothetical protein
LLAHLSDVLVLLHFGSDAIGEEQGSSAELGIVQR